ncbi:MAG: RDD family protein, partial [Vicinamibacteria bacterium]
MSEAPMDGRVPDRNPETIFALDNVPLELPIAGAASRSLAAFLDYLLLGTLAVFWLLGSTLGLGSLGLEGGWLLAIALGGLFLLNWGYFAGCELTLGGRTPGKTAIGARVVNRRGGKASPAAILVRNLVRAVDLFVGVP